MRTKFIDHLPIVGTFSYFNRFKNIERPTHIQLKGACTILVYRVVVDSFLLMVIISLFC